MTMILVVGSTILCAGTIVDGGDRWSCQGTEYPKTVTPGPPIDTVLPDGFTPSGYTWDGVALVQKPVVITPPSPSEVEVAVQSQLDTHAQSWGYDDIGSAATYVGSTVPKFNNEGTVLRNWRDQTWITVESVDAQIASGTLPYPATISAALALLPSPPARPT